MRWKKYVFLYICNIVTLYFVDEPDFKVNWRWSGQERQVYLHLNCQHLSIMTGSMVKGSMIGI